MRIEKYSKDLVITANDKVIGTDGDNLNQTKNFPIWQLSQLILGQLKNSGMVLQFADGSNPDIQIGAEGYFFTEGNLVSKTQVTKFYFSETTLFGENLTALLNSVGSNLGELYVGITQTNDAGNYGFFNILSVERVGNYFEVGVDLRGTLFSKTFKAEENYSLLFDLASNEFSIEAEGSSIHIYKNGVKVDTATLTINPDDVNLSRLVSGTVNQNGLATFIRDDDTTFTVDFSGFLGSAIPQRTSDLINDGNGTGSPFVTDAYSKLEIDNKDSALQGQIDVNSENVAILQNIDIRFDSVTSKIQLYDGSNALLAEANVDVLDDEGIQIDFDPVGKTLVLKDKDGNILDSVPVASFAGKLANEFQFNAIDTNRLELLGVDGSVISFVNLEIFNIAGLQEALNSKEPLLGNPTVDGEVLMSSVAGARYWSSVKVFSSVGYNAGDLTDIEFRDQDGTLIDNIKLSISNITDLQTTLENITTSADDSYIPNTALNNYVKLSDSELAGLRASIERYNARVLAAGGTIEQQISVKDVIGNDKNAGNIIRNINIQNGVVKDIELDFLEIDDVQGLIAALDNKEFVLGNPTEEGASLTSAIDGTRAWRKLIEDKHHAYEQLSATNSWTINHGLNKRPSISLVDSDENQVEAKKTFISDNQVTITFNTPFAGKAYFN